MRILGIGICPPPAAKENPSVTPELLASCLARYSRSNKGIDAILAAIDWNDPDRSVDSIFKFVDYGHASIAGMTGGIALVVDGCSMFLAYKLFELSRYADGQESSTRYIKLDTDSLPDPGEIGIPSSLSGAWQEYCSLAFSLYQETYEQLDRAAKENPLIVRVPAGADQKAGDRIRKNYALDRARYFIPFATKTNVALVMTARAWGETIKQLDSLPMPEARTCARGLRAELEKFSPRLVRHAAADAASMTQAARLIGHAVNRIRERGVPVDRLGDKVHVSMENRLPRFLPLLQQEEESFAGKSSRYSTVGTTIRRIMVRAAWNNMAIAELRDLNRHRTGFRFSPLAPVGFYLPDGISHPKSQDLLKKKQALLRQLADHESGAVYVYGLLLGTQVTFEHSTHLDYFIYEIELRTGMGAHFRYAEHLGAVCDELLKKMPELQPHIEVGNAEPE
ncbi:MAG: FAD-dependent thymidylate synthase [Chitinispirillaceae bacterium]|nr:FAD-dependent thymidylate synthase [Chitinispirillaceae bacterium]